MSKDFYQRIDQKIYFQREVTYGSIYDPEGDLDPWEIVDADYAHWRRLDKVPDAVDVTLPFISKDKIFDIGDGKHPSMIASGNIEPQEFTIETAGQTLEFLALAIGNPAYSSHGRSHTERITCVAKGVMSDNDYFLLDVIDTNIVKTYCIWFDVSTGGAEPVITGISNFVEIPLDGAADTATGTADAAKTAITTAAIGITATNVGGILILTHTNNGAVRPAQEGAATTGFSFGNITQWGATTFTVAEGTGYSLPSFTFQVEQKNAASAESIVYNLFGCVIESAEILVDFGEKIVKGNFVFKTPYALENSNGIATNVPISKRIAAFPTMETLKESADNYLIQMPLTVAATTMTDLTPKSVERVSIKIINNVEFKSDIAYRYGQFAIAGKRDVSLNIVGFSDEKELFKFWHEAYVASGGDWIPTNATGRINTKFKLQRDATYDYILMSVYNWLVEEHNLHFQNIDEGIKGVDITLTGSTPDSNGRIIDSMTMVTPADIVILAINSAS